MHHRKTLYSVDFDRSLNNLVVNSPLAVSSPASACRDAQVPGSKRNLRNQWLFDKL